MALVPDKNISALVPTGTEAFFFDTVDSTNQVAAAHAGQGGPMPAWFIAANQTAGRGRRGRVWTSETGNFYGSYLFTPFVRPEAMGGLPFAVCLAVRSAVIDLGVPADQAACKWPNDLMVHDKKISGILIESSIKSSEQMGPVIVGIGVNLAHYPSDAQINATSLKDYGLTVSPEQMLTALSKAMNHWLDIWQQEGSAAIYRAWSEHAWGMGQSRIIRTSTESFEATLLYLGEDGGLRVRLSSGREQTIYAGDVFPPQTNQ